MLVLGNILTLDREMEKTMTGYSNLGLSGDSRVLLVDECECGLCGTLEARDDIGVEGDALFWDLAVEGGVFSGRSIFGGVCWQDWAIEGGLAIPVGDRA